MGWMTTYKDPKESVADFLKRECLTWSLPPEAHPQVIASATGSSCIAFAVRFFAAYWDRRSPPQRTFIPDRDGSVTTALIFLTNSGERGSRSYNFGYKDMDETMGPCEPVAAAILRHLSALDLENGGEVAKWAQAWRDHCKAYSAARGFVVLRAVVDGVLVVIAAARLVPSFKAVVLGGVLVAVARFPGIGVGGRKAGLLPHAFPSVLWRL